MTYVRLMSSDPAHKLKARPADPRRSWSMLVRTVGDRSIRDPAESGDFADLRAIGPGIGLASTRDVLTCAWHTDARIEGCTDRGTVYGTSSPTKKYHFPSSAPLLTMKRYPDTSQPMFRIRHPRHRTSHFILAVHEEFLSNGKTNDGAPSKCARIAAHDGAGQTCYQRALVD